MKTIGLLGGISWVSTAEYYRVINETVKHYLGEDSSAKILMYSVNFKEIEMLRKKNDWEEVSKLLIAAAINIEKGGADFLLICSNTMHKMANEIQQSINIPLLHSADAITESINKLKFNRICLLGTQITMEQDFYKSKLISNGFDVLIPDLKDRKTIDKIIYHELCAGKFLNPSKRIIMNIIEKFKDTIDAVILGCTELSLLVDSLDNNLPIIDTTKIHSQMAVKQAIY